MMPLIHRFYITLCSKPHIIRVFLNWAPVLRLVQILPIGVKGHSSLNLVVFAEIVSTTILRLLKMDFYPKVWQLVIEDSEIFPLLSSSPTESDWQETLSTCLLFLEIILFFELTTLWALLFTVPFLMIKSMSNQNFQELVFFSDYS